MILLIAFIIIIGIALKGSPRTHRIKERRGRGRCK